MDDHVLTAESWVNDSPAGLAGGGARAAVIDRPRPVTAVDRSSSDPACARSHLSFLEEMDRARSGGPPIPVLCWPDDADEAARLARRGIPRLLIIGPTTAAVHPHDELEDWVRLPVTDEDAGLRLRTLRYRAAQRPPRPWLDGAGRLMFGDQWVVLSETEERLAGLLVDHLGQVVPTEELLKGGWPSGPPTEDGFRPMISRLRRRCVQVGLEITTVRGRGYGMGLAASR